MKLVERVRGLDFRRREVAGRHVGVSYPRALAFDEEGGEVVVDLVLKQAGFEHRAGRDDAHHVALDQPAARRLALHRRGGNLLADGDAVAFRDERAEVSFEAVVRDARERDADVAAHRLRGQDDVQLAREQARVVVEGFVEVADAEEQQRFGVAALDVEVLLPERGGVGGHRSKI